MKKATTIILVGIVLLFLGGLVAGQRIFPAHERSLAPLTHDQTANLSPAAVKAMEKHDNLWKARLAFSSFDLLAGFSSQELENLPALNLIYPFAVLMACLWLVVGLKRTHP
ncbi:MAG: hypothetical protein JRI59_08280 [Deltaproteobacteria bacterium]|nr:hypothetical protein [Deltaproteobacteria bacterium]